MSGASIVANQATGAGAGSPSIARKDLWLSQPIHLVSALSGNTSVDWCFIDTPVGSTATITNAHQPSGPFVDAVFTPDVLGSYLIQLTTNGGGPGNIETKVYRVRYDNTGVLANRGWCLPAKNETEDASNYPGNTKGWNEPIDFIFDDIRTSIEAGGLGPSGPAGGNLGGTYPNPTVESLGELLMDAIPTPNTQGLVLGATSTTTLGLLTEKPMSVPLRMVYPIGFNIGAEGVDSAIDHPVGAVWIDPSMLAPPGGTSGKTRTIKLRACVTTSTDTVATLHLSLVDGTIITDSVVVTSTPGDFLEILLSADLTINDADPAFLQSTGGTYVCLIQTTTSSAVPANDSHLCYFAQLEITWS